MHRVMADSKVLKWYEELQPVELHVEITAPVSKNVGETMQTELVDDDAEYWAAFDESDDDAAGAWSSLTAY